MTSLRVAHVTTVDASLRYLLLNQLLSLQADGYDVTGVSSPGEDVDIVTDAGIQHIAVKMTRSISPIKDLKSLWQLYRLFLREKFDIVHTHNPKPGLIGQIAAHLARTPIIVNTIHGYYFHDHMGTLPRQFYMALERFAAQFSSAILFQSNEDIVAALQNKLCAPHKINHLGNGIDLTQFDPSRLYHDDIVARRAELGLAPDQQIVGFVGRLAGRRKGFLDFLAAASELIKQIPNVRFLIAGDPDREKTDGITADIAAQYGLEDVCKFLGKLPNEELPILYAMMDVLVLPSLFEGIPRVLIEAAAMGVPVVATDVRGNREVVQHKQTGYLVPLADVPMIVRSVSDLLQDEQRAHLFGQNAHRLAQATFDERDVFQRIKDVYQHLQQQGKWNDVSG